MVTIEELKLGNRTLEALKFLLSQITELETAISQINISEIKDANTLTKQQIVTLQDVKAAVESINTELSSKKTDFDEKKQNFDTNLSTFRNDKADFDEKKADFDSKNNTALSNFAFIASNVEKINKTSDLLAEAKSILETIKPIEQKAQTALETLANSQNKFTELDALKETLLKLKRSLENISTTGLINDTSASATTTYSSVKIDSLLVAKLDASEKNKYVSLENGKIKSELLPDINAITLNGKSDDVFELKAESTRKYTTLSQNINTLENSLNSGLNSLSNSLKDKIASNLKGVANGLATLDNSGKVPSSQLPKIDAYPKRESDDKFALKTELTDGLPIGAYLSYPSQKTIPAGFMIADGRSLKKAEYTELFDIIGYTYGGSGDNFSLPNFSDGKFMRSIGGNAAALGVIQQDAFQGHYHRWSDNPSTLGWAYNLQGNTSNRPGNRDTNQSPIVQPMSDGVNGEPRTANETRPYNMAVVVIIKAKNVNTPTAGQIDKTILATETKAGITKLKNSITAKQEDAAVTEKAVNDAIEANKSIGVGQTWQDVLTQRKGEVLYTNTTGRPIMVSITADSSSPALNRVALYVGDVRVARFENVNGLATQLCAIVPDKKTYQLKSEINASIVGIMDWVELR